MKNKVTYFFISGRKERLNRNPDTFAKEFFYGYFYLKNKYKKVEIIEYQNNKSFINPVYKILNKISDLPFYCNLLVSKKNYKILRNSQNIIYTNQNTAFSAFPFLVATKLRRSIKSHIFIMGLFGKKMNYKVKDLFRNFFIKLFIYFSDNVIFLGQGEKELATLKYPKYKDKFKFLPFAIDVEFWTPKQIPPKKNQVLFIGNDGMRDYEFLYNLSKNLLDIDFHFVSNNLTSFQFNKNVSLHKGDWRNEELSDEFIKTLYHESSLTILPIKDTYQPSGQSVALQSLSCGTPVLITKTKGFWDKDNFVNGKNIFFLDENNLTEWEILIRNILSDTTKLRSVSDNGRKLVASHYNLTDFNTKLDALLD
jgi:glycosyltransferase involved in cell wall biosynthesis